MNVRRLTVLAGFAGVVAAELWLGFNSGGFFAWATGVAALAGGLAFVVWITSTRRPFEAISPPLGTAFGALVGLAMWTAASQAWSDAQARAVLELDRTLLYAIVVLLAGLAARGVQSRRRLFAAVTTAIVVLCVCGLITRLLPEVWSVEQTVQADRLGYPVSYWNTLGMLAAIAIVGCLHFAAEVGARTWARALAAAAVPLLAVALLLTFSRGAIVVLPIGVLLYLALARSPGSLTALAAIVAPAAIAVLVTFRADAVIEATEPTAASIAEGRTVAMVVAACAVVAAALVFALRWLDDRARGWAARLPSGRRPALLAAGATLVVVGAVALAVGVPGHVADRLDEFRAGDVVEYSGDRRSRLTDLGNNGRIDHWNVALEAVAERPVTGAGAGTYPLLWARDREHDFDVNDGHSLLIEMLGELGIVGAGLVLIAIVALLVGAARRLRGPERALAAAVVAITVMWAIRAQVDWDWEMPVLTAPVLALAAAMAGRTPRGDDEPLPWPGRLPRIAAGLAMLVVLMTPLGIVRSQGHLDEAVADLRAGRCGEAVAAALASNDAAAFRPEPFQVLAFCDVRLGEGELALAAADAAIERDPDNWRLHYGLAIVQASQGLDPRPALERAEELNPLSDLVAEAQERFDTSRPAAWERRARSAPYPF